MWGNTEALNFFNLLQSDVSGEVIKILREDGGTFNLFSFSLFKLWLNDLGSSGLAFSCMFFCTEPVGYGDALIAILPSFPGIKKLQQ